MEEQLKAAETMKSQIEAKMNDLDNYWIYLNIETDSSSPYYMSCQLNDLLKYEKNYKKRFADSRISKADIVKNFYKREYYNSDLAFECLSFGQDFNFD